MFAVVGMLRAKLKRFLGDLGPRMQLQESQVPVTLLAKMYRIPETAIEFLFFFKTMDGHEEVAYLQLNPEQKTFSVEDETYYLFRDGKLSRPF